MQSDLQRFRHFKPPGPVASAFMADSASIVRAIRGPYGSGKTVACIFTLLQNASMMPVCRDGEIHYRVAIIGVTYGQLERNLYPTWHSWLPKDGGGWTEGEWEGGGGRFATQRVRFVVLRAGKKVVVNFEAIFAAIGEASVEQFVRGFEPTDWYLYEVDQMADGIIEAAVGRRLRYPNADMLGRRPDYRSGVICDLNAPDIDSWYYNLFEVVKPDGYLQYVQPSALSAQAENTHNLAPGYYDNLLKLNSHKKRWVKRFLKNEYGPSEAGNPVYGEDYSDQTHLVDDLKALPGVKLLVGFDQGRNGPAMIIGQRDKRGQLRILAEHAPGRSGTRRFARECVQVISEVAPDCPLDAGYCDPAGYQGSDHERDELGWAEIVADEMGIGILPAPTNALSVRLEAVRDELTTLIDGSTPSIVISRARCPMLRKGFASHYMFEKRKPGQSQPLEPIKNEYSNPHDALQYLLLGEQGRYGVVAGKRDGRGGHGALRGRRVPEENDGNVILEHDI